MSSTEDLIGSVNGLVTAVEGIKRERSADKKSNRRTRILAVVTAAGLVLDLLLSAAVVRSYRVQSCRNATTSQFFAAELRKVQGQDAGLRMLRSAGTDQAQALAGFNEFLQASEHYVAVVERLRERSADNPFWGC